MMCVFEIIMNENHHQRRGYDAGKRETIKEKKEARNNKKTTFCLVFKIKKQEVFFSLAKQGTWDYITTEKYTSRLKVVVTETKTTPKNY